jgi:predicted SnoaL-like aldol condensation-catalyzing enzyme
MLVLCWSPAGQDQSETNKAIVRDAFDTLFNKRDYAAAERLWAEEYIQHSAHIPPGRDGLFELIKTLPGDFAHELELIMADGDMVVVRGRFTGHGQPAPNRSPTRSLLRPRRRAPPGVHSPVG